MIGSIVLPQQRSGFQTSIAPLLQAGPGSSQHMDPLSEVLALMKPQSLSCGGLMMPDDLAVLFPKHQGVKCYAMLAGECWLVVEGESEPVLVRPGDCFLLPRGVAFRLTTDLSLEPVHYTIAWGRLGRTNVVPDISEGARFMAGGFFGFTGSHAELLLQSLPPIVHLRSEADKAAMRWSLERMREELRDPQPGSALIAQQLAYMMLIQALRLHLADAGSARRGWLSALTDKHMSVAIASMHNEPGHPWTLESLAVRVGMSRSVFALRFRETVGATPMEYLTRWRMLLAAERLNSSADGLSVIAQSLGYESESAFGKAFRRVMGCSPRQYARPSALGATP
ncbi:Transcriptional regulator, AraC family [Acidisarcina polymorpha]|uniref:Transcriptional regulator, AraC family n=1 Tax=Acidisarcina polymorpha TaxID=2211140 RepID=A0A2Z5FXX0_9BACT|nr:AraC family transcriptional regulator [Acidisarcina polymorpha]AXC11652.1 Transcriptional regulator, AraC family [Acidisarcina polymorpha]